MHLYGKNADFNTSIPDLWPICLFLLGYFTVESGKWWNLIGKMMFHGNCMSVLKGYLNGEHDDSHGNIISLTGNTMILMGKDDDL